MTTKLQVIIYLSKSREYVTQRVSPKVNYEPWIIMMCQCRFISGNKFTTLMDGIDKREAMPMHTEGIWEMSVLPAPPPTQFCCEPKISLKHNV